MDTEKFAEAQSLYDAGDYRKSARLFLESIEKGTPIGNGPAYHMAGNSFMRLKRYSDAAVVFEHALRDDTYQRHGAVEANLANSYIRTGDYSAAVAHYDAALNLGNPEEAYKYYVGMAQAYMQQEQYDHAAVAYKHAALNEYNPAPGKALVNLGLAMMASGNPKGAVEAYRAALASPEYENKGRALLNMGVAYHAQGMWHDAIRSIEEAQVLHGYQDSALAQRTIADARKRLAIEEQVEAADAALVADDEAPAETPMQQQPLQQAPPQPQPAAPIPAYLPDEDASEEELPGLDALLPDSESRFGKAEDVDRFFSRTEQEAAAAGRARERRAKGKFRWLKIVAIVVLVLAILAGAAAALLITGQGYPSAKATVSSLLDEYGAGRSISQMWTYGAQKSIESQMVIVPIPNSYTIDAVKLSTASGSRSLWPDRTTVTATVYNDFGDTLVFSFVLAREGIGWKIVEVIPEVGSDGGLGGEVYPPDGGSLSEQSPQSTDESEEMLQEQPGDVYVEEPVTGPEMQGTAP